MQVNLEACVQECNDLGIIPKLYVNIIWKIENLSCTR